VSNWTIGAYDLLTLAGAGGAGEVWAARHRELDLAVAVKLLVGASTRNSRDHSLFRHEAAMLARLDHPRVVRVYDIGEVPEYAPYAAGTPYLVMEWLDGGTIAQNPPRDWPSVRQVLRDIALGLAHAHARGVLHRDLKPANILFAGPGDVRVVDFGIARGIMDSPETDRISGTPTYMAPEQASGSAGAEGPWTDLYALGVLAWHLVTGVPPFHGRTSRDTMLAHLHAPLPSFYPLFSVPRGVEALLRRMLARKPRERFGLAADLVACLDELPAGPPRASSGALAEDSAPTLEASNLTMRLLTPALGPERELALGSAPAGPRTLPERWELPPHPHESPRSIGLGLFGLRSVPFVGRASEREVLWSELRAVVERGTPRAVLVTGLSGFGKSRLVTAFAEHAEEVGAARTLVARCGPDIPRDVVLRGALTRWLMCGDNALATRLESSPLPEADRAAVKAVLHGSATDRSHLRAVWTSLIGAACQDRPVILWIEGAAHGAEALAAALALLEAAELPVLCVCTVDTDEIVEESAPLDRLRERARTFTVGPLGPTDAQALVFGWLGLAPELAGEILQRAEGDPSFIADLIGECVRGALLVPGSEGFYWKAEAGPHLLRAPLPREKVAAVTDALQLELPGARTGLLLAALLGTTVSPEEWRDACQIAGIPEPGPLLHRLLGLRLLVPIEGRRYLFAGAALREAVRASASPQELPALHRICARALERQRPLAATQLRVARHWLAAGDLHQGVTVMAEVLAHKSALFVRGELRKATAEFASALEALALPPDHVLRAWLTVIEADMALILGKLSELERLLQPLTCDDPGIQKIRRSLLAQYYLLRGHPEQVLTLCEGHLDEIVAPYVRALVELGRLDEAERALPQEPKTSYLLQRAAIARLRGETEAARQHLRQVLHVSQLAGELWSMAEAHSAMGDLCRHEGENAEAQRWYAEALRRFRALGSGDLPVVELNMSLLELADGRPDQACQRLMRCRATFSSQRRTFLLGATEIGLAAAGAALGDWEMVERATTEGLPRVRGFVESDLAWLAEQAGTSAARGGRADLAAPLLELAREQWLAMGRAEDARRVELTALS
jgi:serine/threonine protein kinase/tetratricopeptide (TPR) repeat protein